MAILSEKRQKCFGLRRKDVRMRAIICDDDGRFAKKLEQLIMQYYRNMGMTIDTKNYRESHRRRAGNQHERRKQKDAPAPYEPR